MLFHTDLCTVKTELIVTTTTGNFHEVNFQNVSFQELVSYFQQNSLGDNFPFVRTTLRYPYRSILAGSSGRLMPFQTPRAYSYI